MPAGQLRELTITSSTDCDTALPSNWLPLAHLTNLTSLTRCNFGCGFWFVIAIYVVVYTGTILRHSLALVSAYRFV